MGHLSDLAASDLAAHSSDKDPDGRTRWLSGDDHRYPSRALHHTPMHALNAYGTGVDNTCSFGIIPLSTS